MTENEFAKRLAELAADALERLLAQQTPWGEFREHLPQSLETLASRGREAQQYQFLGKPKVFASLEALRALQCLVGALDEGTESKGSLTAIFTEAKEGVCNFLKTDYNERRERMGEPPTDWIQDCYGDIAFEPVSAHVTGLPDLTVVPDLRHTAEAMHGLVVFGDASLDQPVALGKGEKPLPSPLKVAEWLWGPTFGNEGWPGFPGSGPSIVVTVHVLHFLACVARGLAEMGARDAEKSSEFSSKLTSCKKRCKEALDWLATKQQRKNGALTEDTGRWITGGLGWPWGTAFVLHMLQHVEPDLLGTSESFMRAREKGLEALREQAEQGLPRPHDTTKLPETEIQAFLVLEEYGRQVSAEVAAARLATWRVDSMEVGELSYTIQWAVLRCKEELQKELSKPHRHRALGFRRSGEWVVRTVLPALSEQLGYWARCLVQAGLTKPGPVGGPSAKFDGFEWAARFAARRTQRALVVLEDTVKRARPDFGRAFGAVFDWAKAWEQQGDTRWREIDKVADVVSLCVALSSLPWSFIHPAIGEARQAAFEPEVRLQVADDARDVTSPVRELVRQAWAGTRSHVLVRPVSPGLSGAGVVLSWVESIAEARIIKYGGATEIENEVRRYREYVEGYLRDAPFVHATPAEGHLRGIAYEVPGGLVAGGLAAVPSSLRDILRMAVYDETARQGLLAENSPYSKGLRTAIEHLLKWRRRFGVVREYTTRERPVYSFGGDVQGWFSFPWPRGVILEKVRNVPSEVARLVEVDTEDLVQNLTIVLSAGGRFRWEEGLVHGDFHAGNVIVVEPANADDRDEKLQAFLIDFANVRPGGSQWTDFGKFMRDLRQRDAAALLGSGEIGENNPDAAQECLRVLRRLSIRPTAARLVVPEETRWVVRIWEDTWRAFQEQWADPNGVEWPPVEALAALLAQEVGYYCAIYDVDIWDETKQRYYGWKSKNLALAAALGGVAAACNDVLGP